MIENAFDLQKAHDSALIMAEACRQFAATIAKYAHICTHQPEFQSRVQGQIVCRACGTSLGKVPYDQGDPAASGRSGSEAGVQVSRDTVRGVADDQ